MLSALVTTIYFIGLVTQCCLRAAGKGGQTSMLLHVFTSLYRTERTHTLGEYNRHLCLHQTAGWGVTPPLSPCPSPERWFLGLLLSSRKWSSSVPKKGHFGPKGIALTAYHAKQLYSKKEQIYSLERLSTGSRTANIFLITCPFATTLDWRSHL